MLLSGLTVVSATGHTIAGSTVSATVTLKLHDAEALPLLYAVQVMIEVTLSGKVLPEMGLQMVDVMGRVPPAVGENVAVPKGRPPAGGTIMFAGQSIEGGAASDTDTLKLQELLLFALSIAAQRM
jgi:hypothetical protein